MRIGLLSSILLGVERLLILDLSNWFYKAHESLALLAFFGMYFGTLGLLSQVERLFSKLESPLILGPHVVHSRQLAQYLAQLRRLARLPAQLAGPGVGFFHF